MHQKIQHHNAQFPGIATHQDDDQTRMGVTDIAVFRLFQVLTVLAGAAAFTRGDRTHALVFLLSAAAVQVFLTHA